MTINQVTKEIHENSLAHGWWSPPRHFGEIIALCHSELSEALEEDRAGRPIAYVEAKDFSDIPFLKTDIDTWKPYEKPEGIATEMVDCIIRILDWFGHEGIDVEQIILAKHEYNKIRPYKHGKKY